MPSICDACSLGAGRPDTWWWSWHLSRRFLTWASRPISYAVWWFVVWPFMVFMFVLYVGLRPFLGPVS